MRWGQYLDVLQDKLNVLPASWLQRICVGVVRENNLIHLQLQIFLQRPLQTRDVEVREVLEGESARGDGVSYEAEPVVREEEGGHTQAVTETEVEELQGDAAQPEVPGLPWPGHVRHHQARAGVGSDELVRLGVGHDGGALSLPHLPALAVVVVVVAVHHVPDGGPGLLPDGGQHGSGVINVVWVDDNDTVLRDDEHGDVEASGGEAEDVVSHLPAGRASLLPPGEMMAGHLTGQEEEGDDPDWVHHCDLLVVVSGRGCFITGHQDWLWCSVMLSDLNNLLVILTT